MSHTFIPFHLLTNVLPRVVSLAEERSSNHIIAVTALVRFVTAEAGYCTRASVCPQAVGRTGTQRMYLSRIEQRNYNEHNF